MFVDASADYLKDHFPGAPTLPGLVMLESAVRAAAALWDATDTSAADRGAVLERVERLQIVRRVVPGELLTVDAMRDPDAPDPGTAWFTARGTVEGGLAMRARFRLRR